MRFERYGCRVHFARGADDAVKCERFIGLCFFFRHRSVFRAPWRAGICGQRCCDLFAQLSPEAPVSADDQCRLHLHKPKEGFLAGVLVHANATHLADRFVARSSNPGTILVERTSERVRRDANNQWRGLSLEARALTQRTTELGETGKLSPELVANLMQRLVRAGG